MNCTHGSWHLTDNQTTCGNCGVPAWKIVAEISAVRDEALQMLLEHEMCGRDYYEGDLECPECCVSAYGRIMKHLDDCKWLKLMQRAGLR